MIKGGFKKIPVVSIIPQKKDGEGVHKECNIDIMKFLGIRVKLIWGVLLHFNEVFSLLKSYFICPATIQKIWGILPDNFIWKIFQKLTWQNRIYQSSTVVLLILFILINACKPKKSAPGQMKPLTCDETLQFLILAGRRKKSFSFSS